MASYNNVIQYYRWFKTGSYLLIKCFSFKSLCCLFELAGILKKGNITNLKLALGAQVFRCLWTGSSMALPTVACCLCTLTLSTSLSPVSPI